MEEKWDKANKVADATKDPSQEDIELASIESKNLDANESSDDSDTSKIVPEPTLDDEEDKDKKTTESAMPLSIQRALYPDTVTTDEPASSRGFLFAYITSVFSSFVLLSGAAFLGYALLQHFIYPPKNDDPEFYFYFDLAPFYLSIMASLMVFGVLYLFTSRYAAHCVANNHVSDRDWRVYRIVYALFVAYVVAAGASVLASILYIPLGHALIAEDMTGKQITLLVLGSLNIIVWIALLVWQERLVKNGKESMIHGTIVAVAVVIIVIMVGIFPVGSKTNERFDHRITTDLETIERKINDFADDAKGDLPVRLDQLKFDDSPVEKRLGNYRYTVKPAEKSKPAATLYESDYSEIEAMTEEESEAYYQDLYDSAKSSNSSSSTKKKYELCATFRTDSTAKTRPDSIFDTLSKTVAQTKTSATDEFDRHKKGEVCFERSTSSF